MANLSIRNARKVYPNGSEVLKGINMDIDHGQFLILAGDRVVNNVPPKSRDIAIAFQSYALYPTMTVRENISFGLNIRKVLEKEQDIIVERVAETLQMKHLLDRMPVGATRIALPLQPWQDSCMQAMLRRFKS